MRSSGASALLLLALTVPAAAQAPLRTTADVVAALQACWRPPPLSEARPGMEITVRLSFRRDGNILGKPRITYETPGATAEQRHAYRLALAAALARCVPLPFSAALGNAIAGRPLSMRLIDTRQQQRI